MGNIINKILNFVLWVVIPFAVVSTVTKKLGLQAGLWTVVLILIILFFWFKPGIYNVIARSKYEKNHDDAFKWFQKSYDTGRMNPQQGLIYAYLLIRDGHIEKAERLITSIIRQKKKQLAQQNLLAADLNLAIIEWKKNNLKGAIEKMESVYDTGYRSTVHYGTLGVFYILNNDIDKAEEFCLEALEFNPGDASIKDNMGLVYYKKGDLDKAESIYKELFEESAPTFIEAYYNYGLVCEAKKDYAKAAELYQRALGCPEKYLSTVKLVQVDAALSRVEELL